MRALGQPVYALMRRTDSPTTLFLPVPIMGQTDSEARDAALDKVSHEATYVLVRLVADFEGGVQTVEYKPQP